MVAAVSKTDLDALELRLQRLDAKVKVSLGQLGLDFSAPTAAPRKPSGSKGPGGGEQCGGGWIDPRKTCRKGEGSQATAPKQQESQAKPYKPAPQVNEPLTVKPMVSGDIEYDVTAERAKNKGASKFWRSVRNGRPAYFHYFRDRKAVEHWMAEDNAQADADAEIGSDKRRSKEWQAEFRQSYSDHRRMYADTSDYDLLESADRWVSAGKATRGGTMIDVRIGGNKHSRPIRAGFFDPKEKTAGEVEPSATEPVLTNPSRIDPGLAPKAKQPGINAQDVTTTAQQAQLARQQRQAAAAAGDQAGAKAWQEAERKAERDRLQMAMNRGQQQQSSLFGVTEYDETMPLFQRRDSVDPVAQLVGKILRDQLPGAEVLDWSRQPRGITAGRAVSEGLVYRFRCDSDSIGYQPAWDGIDERQWELRSEGFLMARDPSMRLDYRRGGGVKFQQAKTKRQCSKGYGCGSACIAMNKECRVQPSSAISKVRLRQLQALAQEGDAKAAAQAQELQMQRDAKAQGLQQGRQTAKLQKLLEDPRVAEMVRTGKIPEAGGVAGGEPMAGQVRNVKPSEVQVDPERFQYKIGSSATGEVGSLSGVQRWDPNLAGVVSVWQDPADGKTYVVNGHNRLALARRLGAEEVTVRYLKAKDAQEARSIGAMQNIAEGAGTEIDAGKFFRDSGVKTLEEVKAKGLPLNSGKAEKGLALAQLPDEMFQDVVQGNLRVRRAAVIGASGLDQDKQREVYKMLKARPSMTDETLAEYVEHLAVSTRQSQTEIDLFGANETSVDTGLARAELANGLKKALAREARLLGAVSKTQQAKELLEQKGGNVINVEQSQQQANEASSVLRIFDQLKNLSGPIRSALDQAAARVTAGENRNKVARELREAVVQAMEDELRNAGLKPDQPPRDELTMNLFDSADRFDALAARLMVITERMDRRCQRPDGSYYGTSGACRKGKEAGSRAVKKRPSPARQAAAKAVPGEIATKAGGARHRPKAPEATGDSQPTGKAGYSAKRKQGDDSIVTTIKVEAKEPLSTVDRKGKRANRNAVHARVEFRKSHALAYELPSVASARAWLQSAGHSEAELASTMAVSFTTGWSQGSAQKHKRMDLPPATARRVAMAIARELRSTVSSLQDGSLLMANAYSDDGYGDARRRAYAAAGFVFPELPGTDRDLCYAVVRQGKIEPIKPQEKRRRMARKDSAGDPLVEALLALPELGGAAERADARTRFDALEARIDALKRKCSTGYACGSACISPAKECRSEGGSTSKQRAQRLEEIAQGGNAGRGIGQLRGEAAAAKAAEIRGARSERAAQLRQQRTQQRKGGALAVSSGQPGAIDVEVVSSSTSRPEPARPSGGKPGGLADTMRQSLNAMKAADARQMGMVAEQLFESEWILERRKRYRGMSKEQAREVYKAEFAKKLQEADQDRRAAGPSDAARRAAEAGSVAGAMRSLIEDMKASDERLQELTERTIDLRVQAEEFNEGGDEGALGGSATRRQLGGGRRKGRGSRRDAADHWFDYLVARLDAAKRKCVTGYGCGSTCINVKKECRSEGKASTSKERLQRLEQLARGEIKPRGLGVPKVAEARALVEEIQSLRGQRAQELRAQRSERTEGLIPTDQPFAPELEAMLRRGITKRSIRTGAVNYGGEELAEALLKVARAPGQQGVNARKAIAFMEEAGIMPNVAAVDAVEVKRVTDKQIGTPEIPWNDGRKLAKLVQQMGLVTDERMEWYRQDNTQAGRIFVRKAELVRNPSSLKPSPEEERAKTRLKQHIEDLEKESAAFDRGIQQGWRFEEDRKEALSYYTTNVQYARKTYNSLKEGRLNELKWAAQEILTTNTKGLSNNDSGGFYLFGQKAYVARAGDGKGFAAGLKVDAAETDPLRMQSEYSSHLRQYLPERLEAMDKKGADYFLISEGPIAYKGRLSSAEQALSIHIHELGHVIDSFAGVRLRSIPGRYSSSGQNETVLMHELGSERIKSRPPEVMELLQQKRGPSAYALTNDLELFAESFASWVFAPKAFEREHPELYDWVESRVGLARQTMARHGKLAFNESW